MTEGLSALILTIIGMVGSLALGYYVGFQDAKARYEVLE